MNSTYAGIIEKSAKSEDGRGFTSTQSVHRRLRDEIVSLKRLPGDAINEKELALECGVSRTPIREALLRLSEERLVDIVPKSRTTVSKIPVADLLEAQVARTALEQLTVKAAVERARGSDIANLRALLELQHECQELGEHAKFYAADEAMHNAIAVAGGYPGIWKIIEQIKIQVDRYRLLTLPQPMRMQRVLLEHTEIVDAIAARNADDAVEAMSRHLDGLSAEDLSVIRDLNPSYFVGDVEEFYARWGGFTAAPQL
ncbi:GntR family transcriptional regulator [Cohaesibacter celericrescens]|uniref:GntR family transcriptional regulator n=1 Tax=Cohaesibacter celericrescens TaxID=2067669 RepID=UPI0035677994